MVRDQVERTRRRRDLVNGVAADLGEAQTRCAMTVYFLRQRKGAHDRASLEWLLSILDGRIGVDPAIDRIRETLRKDLTGTDVDLAQAQMQYKLEHVGESASLRYIQTPFLDAQVGQLALFRGEIQQKILQLRTDVANVNDVVDEARRFELMTFDSTLGDRNRERVENNLEASYGRIRDAAQRVADLISALPLQAERLRFETPWA